MRRPLAGLVLAVLLALTFAAPPAAPAASADDCEELANALGDIKKGAGFLTLYFDDCKDLDPQKLKDLEGWVDKHQTSLKKAFKKLKKLFKKLRDLGLLGRVNERLAPLPPDDPNDIRVGFTGKDGFPLGAMDFSRRDSGPFDARVTILVGPDGLVDGGIIPGFDATGGLLRLDRPPFDEATSSNGLSTVLLATWDENAHGFSITAQSDEFTIPFSPHVISDTLEVDLRIEQTDTTFTLYARRTPADHDPDTGWVTIFTKPLAAPATPFGFGVVGRGLQAGATVTFDFFRLTGPNIGGPTERPLVNQIGGTVINPLIDARDAVLLATPDLAAASAALQLAADGTTAAQTALASAIAGGTLQPFTQSGLATKALAKLAKAIASAKKAADKGDVGKAPKIEKQIVGAGGFAVTAIGDLFGFKAKKPKDIPLGHPR